jgi:hypothetical protein
MWMTQNSFERNSRYYSEDNLVLQKYYITYQSESKVDFLSKFGPVRMTQSCFERTTDGETRRNYFPSNHFITYQTQMEAEVVLKLWDGLLNSAVK